MIKSTLLILRKDLLIERRSKVLTTQLVPFALIVLIIFAFAFNEFPRIMITISPGLFWVATLFSVMIALQRSVGIEAENKAKSALLMYGIDPAGIYLGKVLAITVQALFLEVVLALAMAVLYGTTFHAIAYIAATCVVATVGISGVGVLFGMMVSSKSRDTLLPMLILPIVAPVLLSATEAWQDYLSSKVGLGNPWLGLLFVFAVVFLAAGCLTFSTILED